MVLYMTKKGTGEKVLPGIPGNATLIFGKKYPGIDMPSV